VSDAFGVLAEKPEPINAKTMHEQLPAQLKSIWP
jgi:hypothetical protein